MNRNVETQYFFVQALQGFEARLSARELCVGSDGNTVVLGKERRNELQGLSFCHWVLSNLQRSQDFGLGLWNLVYTLVGFFKG